MLANDKVGAELLASADLAPEDCAMAQRRTKLRVSRLPWRDAETCTVMHQERERITVDVMTLMTSLTGQAPRDKNGALL